MFEPDSKSRAADPEIHGFVLLGFNDGTVHPKKRDKNYVNEGFILGS